MRVSLVYATSTFDAMFAPEDLTYQRPIDVEVFDHSPTNDARLEHIFSIFNRHDAADQHPDLDRLGLRSLSVGDIVIFGDQAWRCDSVGWSEVHNAIRYEAEAS